MRGSWRLNRTATYWPPTTLMAITAFLSCSPGLLSAGFLYLIWSPTDWTSCRRGYIIIWRPLFFLWASQFRTHSIRPWSRLYPDIPWLHAPVIYTGAFPILTAWPGWRSIYKIWPIDGSLTSSTSLGQREARSNDNEGVTLQPQNWSFNNAV